MPYPPHILAESSQSSHSLSTKMCWAPGTEWIKETASSPWGSTFQRGSRQQACALVNVHDVHKHTALQKVGSATERKNSTWARWPEMHARGLVGNDFSPPGPWVGEMRPHCRLPQKAVPGDHGTHALEEPGPCGQCPGWLWVGGPVQGPEAEDGFPVEILVGGVGADVCQGAARPSPWLCSATSTGASWTCRGTTQPWGDPGAAPRLRARPSRPLAAGGGSALQATRGDRWLLVLLGRRWQSWRNWGPDTFPPCPLELPCWNLESRLSPWGAVHKDSSAGVGHGVRWPQSPQCGDPGAADLLHLPRM